MARLRLSSFLARAATTLLIGMLLALVGITPLQSAYASSSGVVISQVYGGGGNTGATLTNDFIELFNSGSSAVDLTGWSVQYGSSGGTTWNSRTNLSGVLAPGHYYLIQEAMGAGGTVSLPTPDLTGVIAMSATAGKVALVSSTTALSGANPVTDPSVVDFIGYGAANGYETAAAPALTASTSNIRAGGGCTDTDNNSADFSTNDPATQTPPRNTSTAVNLCGVDTAPSLSSHIPASGATNVAPSANISLTFSESVDVSGSWFDITCASSGIHSAAVSGGPQTFALNPDVNFASVESCMVTVSAALVIDQDSADPPDEMLSDEVFSFTTADLSSCGAPATLIHEVQGDGSASPIPGAIHTIDGIVIGDFQGSGGLNGFFLQEDDAEADSDPQTSEGLFIFDNGFNADVSVGDHARVTGRVTEFNGLTELSSVSQNLVCGTALLPAATDASLPFEAADSAEPYEGMLVRIRQTLTASEVFDLGRYGEVLLSSGGRLPNPTNIVPPGPAALEMADANKLRSIVLDDGLNITNPDPTPFMFDEPTLRVGDTIDDLTGVMSFGFGTYRIEPNGPVSFVRSNPRTPAPDDVGGMLKVGAFNVLNFFNGDGAGGGFPTSRGADTLIEYNRQKAKTIAAIAAADPDVAGLMEMENDVPGAGTEAVEDLVDGLNVVAGPGTYAFIDTGHLGTDEIRLAVIYKPSMVTPVGSWATIETGPFVDKSRPPIAQTFEENATGEKFTFVVNHFKSKGSCPADTSDPNADQSDLQGCWNLLRVESANLLLSWLATDPTGSLDPDVLIMGDLNAYAKEDPIAAFESGGYTNLIASLIGPDAYSYVFNGESGYLDHALGSPSIVSYVTGVTEWHNNADEPTVLDYNVEDKSPAKQALNVGTPYRASDHDPVLVGLTLGEPEVDIAPGPLSFGDQLVGTASSAQSVTVTNTGSLPLDIETVFASDGFVISVNTCSATSIAPMEHCTIDITFQPISTGSHNGSLTIPSNAASNPDSVSLSGNGVQPGISLTPSSLTFGDQLVGTPSAVQDVTVANDGTLALTVNGISASGDFAITGGTCPAVPFTLAVGDSCTVGVTFTPATMGIHNESLSVDSDAPGSPHSIALSGTGISDNLLVNGGFEINTDGNHIPDGWIAKGLKGPDGQNCAIAFEDACSLQLGGRGPTRRVSQVVTTSGEAGDRFLFSIQDKASHVKGGGSFEAIITITYKNGHKAVLRLRFSPGTYDWRAHSLEFLTARAYKQIKVTLLFGKDGTAWFDSASLKRVP